jgi:hypothetical protein
MAKNKFFDKEAMEWNRGYFGYQSGINSIQTSRREEEIEDKKYSEVRNSRQGGKNEDKD